MRNLRSPQTEENAFQKKTGPMERGRLRIFTRLILGIRQTQLPPGMRSSSGGLQMHTELPRPIHGIPTVGLKLDSLEPGGRMVRGASSKIPSSARPVSRDASLSFREHRSGDGQPWKQSFYNVLIVWPKSGFGRCI